MTTTTAAPAADSGASPASPTDTKDTGSPGLVPTGPGSGQPASNQSRMMASLAAKRDAKTAAAAAPQAPGSPAGKPDSSGDSPGTSPGKEGEGTDDGADTPDERKQADAVPMAAFKARVGKLSDNVKAAREESARLAHENQRYSTAAQLLQEENERLRQQLRDGVQYDSRDEELADVRLSQRAKERADALALEHEQKLQEMQRNFVQEAEREQIKARLSTQIESALATHRLANRADVIAVMKSRNDISAGEAARMVHERESKRLEALGYSPRQSTPPVVDAPVGARSPGGAGGTGRFANNAKGFQDFLDSRRQS